MYVIINDIVKTNCYDKNGDIIAASVPGFLQTAISMHKSRRSSSKRTGNSNEVIEAGYTWNPENASINLPKETSFTWNDKKSYPIPDYKRRMRMGEICVSPYHIVTTTVTTVPGLGTTGDKYWTQFNAASKINGVYQFETVGLTPIPPPWNPTSTDRLGWVIKDPTSGINPRYWSLGIDLQYTDALGPPVLPPSVKWENFFPLTYGEMDSELIQSAQADVYSLSVDALTALAEAPETVSSLYSVLRTASFMLVNHKALLKKLADSLSKRKINLLDAFNRDMESLQKITPRNSRHAAYLQRKQIKAQKALKRDLRRATKESASAVSSAWLKFRYEIMPNVYLIQDIIKAKNNLGKSFIRETKSKWIKVDNPVVRGATVYGNIDVRHRAWCGVRLKTYSPLQSLLGVASFNPLATAWELIPLSFVVDWFINVGDALSVLVPPSGVTSQGNIYSVKAISDQTIVYPNGSQYKVTRKDYNVIVTNNDDLLGIFANVQINWKRVCDSGALLWSNTLRRRFKT